MALRARSVRMVVGLSAALVALALAGWALAEGSTSGSTVLLVGTYHGKTGSTRTIQAAVNVAQPGDWILVAPGDYHEADDAHVTPPRSCRPAITAGWSSPLRAFTSAA